MFQNVHNLSTSEAKTNLVSAERKINDLLTQLDSASQKLSPSSSSAVDSVSKDWTKAYQNWNEWDHVESLNEKVAIETEKVSTLSKKVDAAMHSHSHDHSEERKIFEMNEVDKKSYCEVHRAKGNYLFHEGLLPKAAEQFQLALSYYEYCFPGSTNVHGGQYTYIYCLTSLTHIETDAEQEELNSLRRICLCNISLCYFRMGYYRNAIESATLALKEDPNCVKALHHRYDVADLSACLLLAILNPL